MAQEYEDPENEAGSDTGIMRDTMLDKLHAGPNVCV